MSENLIIIHEIIDEIKPLIEDKLGIEFDVTIVNRHACFAQPAFNRMVVGQQFVVSVCKNHNYDLTTAMFLIMTHEGLHLCCQC